MKKTDFSVLLRDGVGKRLKQYSRLLSQSLTASLLLLTLMWQNPLYSQGNCSLACHGAQVSLGAECTAQITVAMIGDTSQCIGGDFVVYVITLAGDTIEDALVGEDQIGMTLIASLVDLNSGNSCWSYITVADKMDPTIVCEDDTISCLEMILFDGPEAFDNCSEPEVILINEEAEILCDPVLIKRVTRTYIARDASGNESEPCEINLYLERIDFSLIDFPDSLTISGGDPLECDGNWADANNDGIPDPLDDGLIPGTGVPTIDGVPIFPDFIGFCNALTTFEDVLLPQIGCVRKIMRVWTVREWHCSGETDTLYVQLIEIVDNEGPNITCPTSFSSTTTGHECNATVYLPPAIVSDDCSPITTVTVAYPGGFLNGNGGVFVNLPVGVNVITYTAYDQCYNSSQCTMTITIQDLTPPVAVCDEHTIVSLTLGGIDGLTKVPAEVFDDGSFDACGPVTFRARRMDSCIDFDWTTGGAGIDDIPDGEIDSRDHGTVLRPKVPFSCCDAGAGPIMILLEVTDASGNTNTCMVEVEVQDKIPPVITCPTDITISCEFLVDPDNLGIFGDIADDPAEVGEWCVYDPTNPAADPNGFICGTDGLVIDNCEVDITVNESINLNNCGVGVITRTFIASDANGSRSCTQRIYVQNFDPITAESIIWPLDFLGLECALGTDPEDLDPPFDAPVIDEDECDLIGVNYEDLVFDIVEGACFKILRTWRVIDWCLFEQYGGIVEGVNYFEHVQILKVKNEFGPEFITDQPDIELCNDFDCSGMFVELIQRATDDCTPDNLLEWSYAIDLNNDGTIDIGPFTGLGALIDASQVLPLGSHRVIFAFEDRCGNRTVAEQFIDLNSCKAPVPVCINGLSADLMPVDTDGDGIEDAGMIVIWAVDFDASSYHPCGNPFVFSLAPDVNVTSLTFDCSHVGQGQVPVNLYVTDALGNQAFCETYIIIQDNMGICPGGGGLTGTVTGNVSTETSDNILDVTVSLNGSTMLPINTNHGGMYTFPAMPVGGNYVVSPVKTNDYKNGVSTLDLVHIQKHLLGIKNLESPYKLIAADVNNSTTITAVDLSELRKLILGIYSELPNNSSWRFVDKTYVFPDPYNPWMQPWPENHPINPLSLGIQHADFYGIKVGDVNNTVKANASSIISRGSGEIFTLELNDQFVSAGSSIEVPVYANSTKTLEGIQFSFDLKSGFELEAVHAGLLNVTQENFGWLNNSVLTGSWNDVSGVVMDNSKPLFTLVLKAVRDVNLSSSIHLATDPTPAEAYTRDTELMELELTFRNSQSNDAFELLQNEPNPFSDVTSVGFILPESGPVSFTLFDVTGKQILNRTLDGLKGLNKVELHKDKLNAEGLIYYQVQFQGYTATKKMLIL